MLERRGSTTRRKLFNLKKKKKKDYCDAENELLQESHMTLYVQGAADQDEKGESGNKVA